MAKTFDAAVAEHNNRSNVLDFLFHIEHRKDEIKSLRKLPFGADWLNTTKKTLIKSNDLIPREVGYSGAIRPPIPVTFGHPFR